MEKINSNNELVKKSFIKYNGFNFPVIEVNAHIVEPNEYDESENVMFLLADHELWFAISNDEDVPKGKKEEEIDNEIYYYCDIDFIASNPSIEDIKEYFAK